MKGRIRNIETGQELEDNQLCGAIPNGTWEILETIDDEKGGIQIIGSGRKETQLLPRREVGNRK